MYKDISVYIVNKVYIIGQRNIRSKNKES